MKTLKFLVTTLIVFCCGMNASAQEVYNSFLEEGKAWHYSVYNYYPETHYKKTAFVSGDTIINGLKYKRICEGDASNFQYGLREDGKTIRISFDDSILYDFGLTVGSVLYSMRVTDIDTIKVGDRLLRRLRFLAENEIEYDYWVEGIGGLSDLTRPFGTTGVTISFLSCDVNGETILTREDILNQPSYHQTDASVSCPVNDYMIENSSGIFDLQGRRVNVNVKKGLYIKDGRKQMVR